MSGTSPALIAAREADAAAASAVKAMQAAGEGDERRYEAALPEAQHLRGQIQHGSALPGRDGLPAAEPRQLFTHAGDSKGGRSHVGTTAVTAQIERDAKIPDDVIQGLKDLGCLGIKIPEEYGGSGLRLTEASVIMEEINRSGANSGSVHGQMYNMGTLLRHGSAAQKKLAKKARRCAQRFGEPCSAMRLLSPVGPGRSIGLPWRHTPVPDRGGVTVSRFGSSWGSSA